MEPEQVENALYDLRKWGYIDWERRAEPDLHQGRLLHYTLPAARWSEEDITKAILEWLAKQKGKSTQRAMYFHEKSTAPHGQKVHSPLCTPAESTQPAMPKSTQPAMTRNLLREPERKNTDEAAHATLPLDDADHDPSDGARQRMRTAPKATEEQFDRFWVVYPKREGKAEARKKFLTLSREDAELAIAGAEAYAKKCQADRTEPKYVKWPQGWLSERRFEDFAPGSGNATPSSLPPYWWQNRAALRYVDAAEWRSLLATHGANGTWSVEMLGPAPGTPGCVVPADVIREGSR